MTAKANIVHVEKLPKCDFCAQKAKYDGRTTLGPWAAMCLGHFFNFGCGLGTGLGQKLVVQRKAKVA